MNIAKNLPFEESNQIKYQKVITDPMEIVAGIQQAENLEVDAIIIDSLTFLADMVETQYVQRVRDTQKGWGVFQQYFKDLFLEHVAKSTKTIIFLAHTLKTFNENKGDFEAKVPVKGALKNTGFESYFSTVLHCKKVPFKDLEEYIEDNELLTFSNRENRLKVKHVFQTDITTDTLNDRIRCPDNLFKENQVFINNDIQMVLDRLNEFYKD